jgi:hypothetical protein
MSEPGLFAASMLSQRSAIAGPDGPAARIGCWPFPCGARGVTQPRNWAAAELPGLGFRGLAIHYHGTGTGPRRAWAAGRFRVAFTGSPSPESGPRLNYRGQGFRDPGKSAGDRLLSFHEFTFRRDCVATGLSGLWIPYGAGDPGAFHDHGGLCTAGGGKTSAIMRTVLMVPGGARDRGAAGTLAAARRGQPDRSSGR